MNKLAEKIAEGLRMDGVIIGNKAKEILPNKPEGFHPIKKAVYRRECKYMYNELDKMIARKQSGRIIGNKGVSNGTKLILEQLKNNAR